MRFDIDAIDLVSVILGFLMIGLFSGVLMFVGILFGISLITSVGFGILVDAIEIVIEE
jgi:hypothetical protein